MFVYLELNLRIQPLDGAISRSTIEDILIRVLQEEGKGDVTGGGTFMMGEDREISGCEIEINLIDDSQETIDWLLKRLKYFNFPKGSKLTDGEELNIDIGSFEGIGVYIDGVNLPDEVYARNDVNDIITELETLMGERGSFYNMWQGPKWAALYFYGQSFEEMKKSIEEYTKNHEFFQGCEIKQIA